MCKCIVHFGCRFATLSIIFSKRKLYTRNRWLSHYWCVSVCVSFLFRSAVAVTVVVGVVSGFTIFSFSYTPYDHIVHKIVPIHTNIDRIRMLCAQQQKSSLYRCCWAQLLFSCCHRRKRSCSSELSVPYK